MPMESGCLESQCRNRYVLYNSGGKDHEGLRQDHNRCCNRKQPHAQDFHANTTDTQHGLPHNDRIAAGAAGGPACGAHTETFNSSKQCCSGLRSDGKKHQHNDNHDPLYYHHFFADKHQQYGLHKDQHRRCSPGDCDSCGGESQTRSSAIHNERYCVRNSHCENQYSPSLGYSTPYTNSNWNPPSPLAASSKDSFARGQTTSATDACWTHQRPSNIFDQRGSFARTWSGTPTKNLGNPTSPGGYYGESGRRSTNDPQTLLSPTSASYYEATGCLRDEWGPETPVSQNSSCYGYTDGDWLVPHTPTSPMSASYYEATGCFPNNLARQTPQSPSMSAHGRIENLIHNRAWTCCSPMGSMTAEHSTDNANLKTQEYNVNGSDWSPQISASPRCANDAEHSRYPCPTDEWMLTSHFSPCFDSTSVNLQDQIQSPTVTFMSPQTLLYNTHRLCYPNTPPCVSADHFDHSASAGSIDDPHNSSVTTPLSQDFLGLLDHRVEVCVTRQEIKEHNEKLGWQQWFALKGNVYTTVGFRDHFLAYNSRKAHTTDSDRSKCNKSTSSEVSSDVQVFRRSLGSGHETDPKRHETEPKIHGTHQNMHETDQQMHVTDHKRHEINGSNVSVRAESTRLNNCNKIKYDVNPARSKKEGGPCTNDDDNSSDANSISHSTDDDNDDNDGDEQVEEEETSEEHSFNVMWRYDVLAALRKSGLGLPEIESEIGVFRIGTLRDPSQPRWKFWDNVRADVIRLHDDIQLHRSDVSEYQREYAALLKRWLRRFLDVDPDDVRNSARLDGNARVFFLPTDVDPEEDLRRWISDLPPLDTSLPESGWAWLPTSVSSQLSPPGDVQSIFAASLRLYPSPDGTEARPFVHDIDGDVAWTELPLHVIRDDVMTQNQCDVMAARHGMIDRAHMDRRRKTLGRYFAKKYGFGKEKMKFQSWAEILESGWTEFLTLCASSS